MLVGITYFISENIPYTEVKFHLKQGLVLA